MTQMTQMTQVMKLLLINHYAGTPELGMEYRPYYLAREWVRLGHQVHILASAQSHYRARQPAPGDEVIDGIHYRWVPTPTYAGNGLGRFRNIVSFLSQVSAQTEEWVQRVRPDVVIASSTYPMDNWVAHRLARAAGARFVYEVHDLWPLSPIELSGMSPWHPFALVCSSAERYAYRHADAVVSMLPKVHQHMASRGLDLKKLSIVPNGISPEDWQGPAQPLRSDVEQAIDAVRQIGGTVVGHAGSMGLPNALDVLLDAVRLLMSQPTAPGDKPLRVILVGDGHERQRLVARMAAEGLTHVTWLPPIPKAQIPTFLAAIDIAYIGWQRVPIYRFGIAPNKLMDYMMASRAVLHSVEAGNDPVAEAGCGLTVPPEDPMAVARGLRQLAQLSPKERRVLGDRGRAFVMAHHSYPVLARRFLDAVAPR